uniref:Uncharacterized protein n=1 Tax=Rhizophora mucronata TaxID=61149 RepID=A0A2P2QNF8_RHIMU
MKTYNFITSIGGRPRIGNKKS